MDLKEIRAVIDLMSKNKLAEFELEKDNFKIKIKKTGDGAPQISYAPAPPAAAPAPAAATPAPVAAPAADDNTPTINSPMVGTFYRAPSQKRRYKLTALKSDRKMLLAPKSHQTP